MAEDPDGDPVPRTIPKSTRHKRILDLAADRPGASMQAIADEIPSATVDLVENVLEEYGDPGENSDPAPTLERGTATADSEASTAPAATPTDTQTADDTDAPQDPVSTTDSDETATDPSEKTTPTDLDTTEIDIVRAGQSAPEADAAALGSDADTTTATPVTNTAGTVPNEQETKTPSTDDSESTEPQDDRAALDGQDHSQIKWQDLTPKQQQTFRAIAQHPDATQAELADHLGVSAPTISNRVNAITGFEWQNREEIVTTVLTDAGIEPVIANATSNTKPMTESSTAPADTASQQAQSAEYTEEFDALQERLEQLEQQIDAATRSQPQSSPKLTAIIEQLEQLEQQIASLPVGKERDQSSPPEQTASPLHDPALAQKVLHACLNSDTITEDEELQIIESLLE